MCSMAIGKDCPDKQFLPAPCIGRSVPANGMVSLDFAWSGPAPLAGGFFMIRPRRSSVFLGRPLSAAAWEPGLRSGPGKLSFLAAIRGAGTRELSEVVPGETVFLAGPLGRGWTEVSGAPKVKAALVSGGVGVAPLACFARELQNQNQDFDFYAGYRSCSFGLEGIQPGVMVIASEDGSQGKKGRIPDFFSPKNYGIVYACGPEAMLKTIAEKCRAEGVPCYVSLERRMACGTGACLGCTIKTRSGNRRCCADGPVFNGEDIFYDE